MRGWGKNDYKQKKEKGKDKKEKGKEKKEKGKGKEGKGKKKRGIGRRKKMVFGSHRKISQTFFGEKPYFSPRGRVMYFEKY